MPVPAPDPLAPAITTVRRPSGWSEPESLVETTVFPFTVATRLVVGPPYENARIEITFALEPTLMNLPLPEASSFGSPGPLGSRKYCHFLALGSTRSQ